MPLLREYATRHSEAAFEELVKRRIGFVYSAALRQVREPQLAEEVTQAVFVILAQKAGKISGKTILAGWLFRTTRFTALTQIRAVACRQRQEKEVQMQTEFQSAAADEIWNQMSPLLDEALAALGEKDRQAVLLRFFENKSLAEVGSSLGMGEDAARKRVGRALEKLHRYFNRRGISSTTAIIAGEISANSIQAAPAVLAKSVTAVAVAKGTAAGSSTLTLIKGALKLVAWPKAKTAVVACVGIVFAAGTTTVAIKEIQDHRTYAWQSPEGAIVSSQFNQPPQVRILPSKFHKPAEGEADGKLVGTGLHAQDIVAMAYGYFTPARAIFHAALPADRYDFIACLSGGIHVNENALRTAVQRKFGVVAKAETRNADVWLLKMKSPDAPGLKRSKSGNGGNGLIPSANELRGWNEPIANLAVNLEYMANFPIVDETGLTNRFDFDLNCSQTDLEERNMDKINQALGQLGLELVPTNMPLKLLIVEKAK